MSSLLPMLRRTLQRPAVQDWLTAPQQAALESDALSPLLAVVVGRLLRGGLAAAERPALDGWLRGSTSRDDSGAGWSAIGEAAETMLGEVDTAVAAGRVEVPVLRLRDDAESLLCLLGTAVMLSPDHEAMAALERSLLERASAVDQRALAAYRSSPPPRVEDEPWLARAAAIHPSAWWLDAVSLGELRTAGFPARPGPPPSGERGERSLRLRAPPPTGRSTLPEVVACEDDLALLADPTVVARLFEGAVEVLLVGLRSGDTLAPGLYLRRRGGGSDGIEAVQVDGSPHPALRGAAGWWVPLETAPAPGVLVVRCSVDGRALEERLPVEWL